MRNKVVMVVLLLTSLACSLQSQAALTSPQIHKYERAQFSQSFIRHNFGEARLSPQIDALKQPIEDK